MIERFKKTRAGIYLQLLSQRPVIGWPLRKLLRILRSEVLQPAHLFPSNIKHNRHQRAVLEKFEAGLK